MANSGASEYEITWQEKPLGFSIVMDTSGNNAYVSSIQRANNVSKGLKLAAQIIAINGVNVEDMEHAKILSEIKKAKCPMTLRFKPRSFATDQASKADTGDDNASINHDQHPRRLIFRDAPEEATHVNGEFELLIKPIHDKPAWQRKDEESDPILLWFWPKTEPENIKCGLKNNVWMIGRRSKLNKQEAYACAQSDDEVPTNNLIWKVYMKSKTKWMDTKINIQQKQI